MSFVGRFFLLVLVLGFGELYLLVKVASHAGFLWTLGLCVFTGVLGGALVRAQGLRTLQQIQEAMARGEVPAVEIVSGLVLLIVGALLLTPGFITDTIGFLLLIPGLRGLAAARLAKTLQGRLAFQGPQGPFGGFPQPPVGDPRQGPESRPRPKGRIIDVEAEDR